MKLTNKQQEVLTWLRSTNYIKNQNGLNYMYSRYPLRESINFDTFKQAVIIAREELKVDKNVKKAFENKLSVKSKPKKLKVESYNPVVTANVEVPNIIKSKKYDTNNILISGDTHFPFEREGYLEHLLKTQRDYNCGTFVHIGDVIDNAYSSFHETNPDGHSAGDELSYAIEHLKPYYKAFPKAKVTLGNHDLLINRKAFSSGLSKRWIKGLDEVLEVPGWDFDIEHVIHNILFTHGTGTSGQNAAYNKALNIRRSVIQGHLHSEANIRFNVSKEDIIFAMQVGCGVDDRKYAFDYAKANPRKFIITCGVVLNKGKLPILVPMDL